MLINLGRDARLAAEAKKGDKGYSRESKECGWQKYKPRVEMQAQEDQPLN
jgi:hypothetical protein